MVLQKNKHGRINGMKKSIFLKISAITFLMAGVVFCGCSNSNDEPIEPVGPKTYTLTIEASKGGSAMTRALTEGENSLVSTWKKDDQVFVKHGSTWCDGSLKPQSEGQTTTLRGMITFNGEVKVNDDLTFQYPRETIDYTEQDGTLESIAAKYDYSVATAKVSEVGANAITVTGLSDFENQQAIVKFTLKDILKDADGGLVNATSLTISAEGLQTKAGSDPGVITISPTSATSEYYVALSGISNTKISLTATVGSDTYFYERPNVTFENGKYYEVTVNMKNQSLYSEPLTFEYVGDGSYETEVIFHNLLDGGTVDFKTIGDWETYETSIILSSSGDKVSFCGNNVSYSPYPHSDASYFEFKNRDTGENVPVYVYGNIMSLISKTDFANKTKLSGEYTFWKLFSNTLIKNHSEKVLLLPATDLEQYCYQSMFEGCTALERAPVLPAATLVSGCYNYMFKGCANLNYIKCLAKSIPEGCTTEWVNGVAESGTFVSADGVHWSAGVNGNPWGSQNDQ